MAKSLTLLPCTIPHSVNLTHPWTLLTPTQVQSSHVQYQTLLVWQSTCNSRSPRIIIIQGQSHPILDIRVSPNLRATHPAPLRQSTAGVTLAVSGLSQPPWDPCVRVSQNTGVTPVVLGFSRDYLTFWDRCVRVSQNTGGCTGSPGIVQRQPNPEGPLCHSTQVIYWQSRD